MSFFHKLWRAAKVLTAFATQMAKLVLIRPRTRPQRAAWLTGLCKRLLRAVDLTYTIEGPVPAEGAVITNHLTYIDIVVHGAIHPCVFVAASETREMPVIGWLSMMGGTVYVQRGAGGSAEKAARGMAKGFRDGLPVVFFPEGGTFVGDKPVMPFHSGLLAEALEANAPVTAGFIRYELAEEDVARGKSARNDVHWGHQSLLAHLWNFMGLHDLKAHVRFADQPIAFSAEAYGNRKVAAVEARAAVLALSGRADAGG